MEKLQDFFNLTLDEFLTKLASGSPTPGGGSTAALTGAMSAALVSMVCNLTIGREKYAQYEKEVTDARDKSLKLMQNLKQCAIDDINEYENVMACFKLPKSEERTQKIQDAYKNAIVPPKNTVLNCIEVIDIAKSITDKVNKNALSDLYSAMFLARCAVLCADENININLRAIKDDDFVSLETVWAKVHKDNAFKS